MPADELFRQLEAEQQTPLAETIAEFDKASDATRQQLERVMQGEGGASRRSALRKLDELTDSSAARFGEFAHAALDEFEPEEAFASIAQEYLGDEDALLATCHLYNPTDDYVNAESKQAIVDYLAAAPEDPHQFAALMYRGAVRDNVRACAAMAPENLREMEALAENMAPTPVEKLKARAKSMATVALTAVRATLRKPKK